MIRMARFSHLLIEEGDEQPEAAFVDGPEVLRGLPLFAGWPGQWSTVRIVVDTDGFDFFYCGIVQAVSADLRGTLERVLPAGSCDYLPLHVEVSGGERSREYWHLRVRETLDATDHGSTEYAEMPGGRRSLRWFVLDEDAAGETAIFQNASSPPMILVRSDLAGEIEGIGHRGLGFRDPIGFPLPVRAVQRRLDEPGGA